MYFHTNDIMLLHNLCKPIKNMKSLSTSEDNKKNCIVECLHTMLSTYKVDSKASFRLK